MVLVGEDGLRQLVERSIAKVANEIGDVTDGHVWAAALAYMDEATDPKRPVAGHRRSLSMPLATTVLAMTTDPDDPEDDLATIGPTELAAVRPILDAGAADALMLVRSRQEEAWAHYEQQDRAGRVDTLDALIVILATEPE